MYLQRKFLKLHFIYILLALTICFGFFIRTYQNTIHPAGFFCDEAGLTYEAFTIVTTGKDSYGNAFPFYFNIFSPRGPVAIYDQVPFVLLFGLTEFASRTASAFYGTVTIAVIFFLTSVLFKNRFVGIFAAFLTAVSPWHIQFSRFGTENIRLPLYFGLFLLVFISGMHKHKKMYILLSLIFLFLAFYSYTAADVFILPFIGGMAIIYRDYFIKNKLFFLSLFTFCLIAVLPFMVQVIGSPEQTRFTEVSVFKNKNPKAAFVQMGKTYIESYSPDFLFLKGDAGMPEHFITRFSVKDFGELYLVALPFSLIGFFYLIKNWKKKENQLILLWILLYPIGSVVAGADGGGPFATRSIIGVLVFQIITAIGITNALNWTNSKKIKILYTMWIIGIFLASFSIYFYIYFVKYPLYSENFWGWQYGAKDIVGYFTQEEKKYDQEIMAPDFNAPGIFFNFYAPDNCTKCIVGLPQDYFNPSLKQLFAVTPLYLRKHPEFILQTQKQIIYPNGSTAFLIGTIKRP